MGNDGIDKEVISLLRPIAAESLSVGIFIHSPMHGINSSLRKRTSDITDTETDDVGFGMLALIGTHLPGYLGKEVAA